MVKKAAGRKVVRKTVRKTAPKLGERAAKRATHRGSGHMKRLQSAASQRRFSQQHREQGQVIGFVPTMGAFHEGHLALIRKARAQCDVVVVSIFVNPLQFSPGEDYTRYPRDLARDMDRARALGVDVVFVPEVEEIYREGFATKVTVGPLAERLCGAERPGHFDGVCTVVLKLIGIVQPHRIYLGEKDRQQLVVLQRMVADLDVDVKFVPVATVREKDGLALSSRNHYLTAEERRLAPRLYQALRLAQRTILIGGVRDPQELCRMMAAGILEGDPPLRIGYVAVVDPETLVDLPVLTGRALIVLAVQIGQARLIDNLLINVPGGRMAESITARRK